MDIILPPLTAADAFTPGGYGDYGTYAAPARVVLCYKSAILDRIGAAVPLAADAAWPLGHHPCRALLRPASRDAGIMHIEIGRPLIEYIVRVLAHFGARQVVVLSSGATLQSHDYAVDLFVVESAECIGDVARHADPIQADVSPLGRELQTCAVAAGVALQNVHAASVEAFFRPTASRVRHSRTQPTIVDMEAYWALRTARELKLELAVIGYVSDHFIDGSWVRRPPDASHDRLAQLVARLLA